MNFRERAQPQPRTLRLLVRRPHLPEFLEHRFLIRRRDPDAGVRDGHLGHMVVRRAPTSIRPPPA